MLSSYNLLKNSSKFPKAYKENVFLLGKVRKTKKHFEILIDKFTPAVVKDTASQKQLKLFANPTVQEIRTKQKEKKLSLISSGSFVLVRPENKIAVIQRSADASVDPSHFTGPAGRCEGGLLETAINETNEEIVFIRHPNKKILFNKSMFIKNAISNKKSKFKVSIFLDGKLFERHENLYIFFDKNNNTLEVRFPIYIDNIKKIMSGEKRYSKQAFLYSESELKNKLLVPTLRSYIFSR